jgi:ATP-dependent DNA helicase RecG
MSAAQHQLELFDRLSQYEGVDVEYKSSRGGLPGSLWETYSAFANTGGGTIWLGVVQRDGHVDIQGVADADKLRSDADLHSDTIRQFRNRFSSRTPDHPWLSEDDTGLLLKGYRRQVTPVHEALQEALVNALIHSDYSGQGGVVIDRYLDRLEFSNPGTLLVSREQLQSGGISECRNKSLQRMFQRLGVGDKAGSGIDKIRSSWAAQHWQSASLRETHRPDRVQLVLPMVSTLPDGITTQLREKFPTSFDTLDPHEVQTLVVAHDEGSVSNQRLQEMLSLHRADITLLLRSLVQRGFLAVEGAGRGTRYWIADPHAPDANQYPPDLNAYPPGFRSLAGYCCTSSHVRARPGDPGKGCHPAPLSGQVSLPQGASTLLDRRPESLRDAYMRGLLQEGLVEQRYPDTPSHRDQAYRTRK